MSTHAPRQLLDVCQEALAQPEDERAAFLDRACGDDRDLRRAAEALLAAQSSVGTFLQVPLWSPDRPRLSAGAKLGPYAIESFIGAGGMGEVYRARDTRIGRTVALKLLPPDVGDVDRRRRFEQEARAVSNLNHPHICTLHDVGSEGETDFLVMEYLEGETLADRLAKGALPIALALEYAQQIADGLAAAHRQGIVHRDLKPANIIVTRKNGVKLIDFGLAKLRAPAALPGLANAEWTTAGSMTETGVILGTVRYMAPEQLEGRPTDTRSDIFSFGAVLYEMITGRRAFDGTSTASIIAAILEREPMPLEAAEPRVPATLDRLVRQCLSKSPEDRPDTAHDVANHLRWMMDTTGEARALPTGTRDYRRGLRVLLAVGVLAVAVGAIAAGAAFWALGPSPPVREWISASPADEINSGNLEGFFNPTPGGARTSLAWTPDGGTLVFVGRLGGVQQLYVRQLAAAEARPLPGTDNAQMPAVAPDGKSVAFWVPIGRSGAIRTVPLGATGPATDWTSVPVAGPPFGLAWDEAGRLVYGGAKGQIWRIAAGGKPEAMTPKTLGEEHRLPSPLPGGGAFLYTIRTGDHSWGDEQIAAQRLNADGKPDGKREVLLSDACDARYVATGHLVFMRRGTLHAVRFDLDSLKVLDTPTAALGGVAQALTSTVPNNRSGAGQFAVSSRGTLAWLPGQVTSYPLADLVRVNRAGELSWLAAPSQNYLGVQLSRDGRRLAVAIREVSEVGVWVYDMDRPGVLEQVNRQGENIWPAWFRDGKTLAFSSLVAGRWSLKVQSADGLGSSAPLVSQNIVPLACGSDDREWFGVRIEEGGRQDIVRISGAPGMATVQPLTSADEAPMSMDLSPDGRLIAYQSERTGDGEVYVRPYGGPAAPLGPPRWRSVGGGRSPAWNPDPRRHELFFSRGEEGNPARGQMMSVDLDVLPLQPRPLFTYDRSHLKFETGGRSYGVSPDGRSFYTLLWQNASPSPIVSQVLLIRGWATRLNATAAARSRSGRQ